MSVGDKDSAIRFGEILPVADESVDLVGNITLQYLLYNGATDFDNDYIWDGEVWLKDGEDDASSTIVPAGQGMWIDNQTGAAVSLRSSGEVNQKEIEYLLRSSGCTAAANAFPAQITFGSVVPVADESVDLVGNITLQYLLYNGATDFDNDYIWDGEVWLKDSEDDASEMPMAPGQGLWIDNQAGAPVVLHIAAPEL